MGTLRLIIFDDGVFVNLGFRHNFDKMNMRLLVFEINSILAFPSASFAVDQTEQDIDRASKRKLSPCQITFHFPC